MRNQRARFFIVAALCAAVTLLPACVTLSAGVSGKTRAGHDWHAGVSATVPPRIRSCSPCNGMTAPVFWLAALGLLLCAAALHHLVFSF